MHFRWWLPTLRRNLLTPNSTLKTEAEDCYEITRGHNPERHSFKNVPASTGWSISENIYIMVVADEKTASQRPVTRPSILLATHSNTSPRSWIHSYSPDPSPSTVPTPLLHTSLSTQKFTHRPDHFTYTKTATDRSTRGRTKQDENVKKKQLKNKMKHKRTED